MRKCRFLLQVFFMVTTLVVIATALFITVVNPEDMVESIVLWQIPLVSLLCTMATIIFPWDRTMGKKEIGIRIALHYLIINVIVLISGYWFGWYQIDDMVSVIVMVITIAVIYALVSIASWTRAAREAKQMNERLKEYQQEKNTSRM